MNMMAVLERIAIERPNHSEALDKTAAYIRELLSSWGVPFSVQEFPLRPYMMLIISIAILLLALGLAYAVYRKRPVAALLLALAIPVLLVLEYEFFVPVLSWLVEKKGENIIMNFPSPIAARELIFCAHYDSKTDFWDHIQRARVYQFMPAAFITGILLALWTFLVRRKEALSKMVFRIITLSITGIFVLYIGLVALGFGGFIFVPKHKRSSGAVDNGGSVVALLALARDIHEKRVSTGSSGVTIVLTAGEEVTMQGAHHYVRKYILGDKDGRKLPRYLVNLELAGQRGDLFYVKEIAVFLKHHRASPELISRIRGVWRSMTGREMVVRDVIGDDSHRFMAAGVPAIIIGHMDLSGLGMEGFHCEKDNMSRVDPKNLAQMVRVLESIIRDFR